jgi:hypothetical protein
MIAMLNAMSSLAPQWLTDFAEHIKVAILSKSLLDYMLFSLCRILSKVENLGSIHIDAIFGLPTMKKKGENFKIGSSHHSMSCS